MEKHPLQDRKDPLAAVPLRRAASPLQGRARLLGSACSWCLQLPSVLQEHDKPEAKLTQRHKDLGNSWDAPAFQSPELPCNLCRSPLAPSSPATLHAGPGCSGGSADTSPSYLSAPTPLPGFSCAWGQSCPDQQSPPGKGVPWRAQDEDEADRSQGKEPGGR